MRCTCKLKEKLKEAQAKRDKYSKKCDRIFKMIANREGKKLRLVIWDYEGRTTMYVVYSKFPVYQLGSSENLFHFSGGNLDYIPWSDNLPNLKRIWKRDGSKISHGTVTYYGKSYCLNKKSQVCEVTGGGWLKKRATESVMVDLMEELR